MKHNEPFLKGYRQLRIPIVDDAGNSTWPDVFPIDAIDAMRNTVGVRHFSAQMMLSYIAEERARLAPDAIRFYSDEIDWRCAKLGDILVTGMAAYWDPSSAAHGADASVCVLILRDDRARRAYIHDIRYMRVTDDDVHPMATQCHAVLDFMTHYNLRHMAIEVNGIGNAMPEILRDTAIKRGQAVIVQKIINTEKKERRILNAIEPLLSTGRLFMHERVKSSPLVDEMVDWAPTASVNHDDGIDAVAGALRMTVIPIRPHGQTVRPISARTDFRI